MLSASVVEHDISWKPSPSQPLVSIHRALDRLCDKAEQQTFGPIESGEAPNRWVVDGRGIPFAEYAMNLLSQIPADRKPVDLACLALKGGISERDPTSLEVLNIHGSIRHVDLVPRKKPFVREAQALDIELCD